MAAVGGSEHADVHCLALPTDCLRLFYSTQQLPSVQPRRRSQQLQPTLWCAGPYVPACYRLVRNAGTRPQWVILGRFYSRAWAMVLCPAEQTKQSPCETDRGWPTPRSIILRLFLW